jgi:rod shape-determining protein MreD
VKVTAVLLTIVVSLLLQVVGARYAFGAAWRIDFVLVGVVYAAIYWGPAAGILAGTLGGLTQDLLSSGIVGVGGLAKTLTGFAAGTFAAQFIVVRPQARVLVVMVATVAHRAVMIVLYALIDQRWPAVLWGAILGETLLNAAAALAAFQATELLPGAISRNRQARRSSIRRRQW